MLEQVENKIQELKKLRAEEYYKKKDADLKAWGLTTKTDGKKVTPIIVTDEEYEHILRARQKSKSANKTNMVANTLAAMAWIIFIVGFIVGIVSGTEEFKDIYGETLDTKFEFMVALKYWIEYFIYGILVLALAEIIKLLHSINNKIK